MSASTWAERQAELDVQWIKAMIQTYPLDLETGQKLLVDGTQYSPSWRALTGGAAVWARMDRIGDTYELSQIYQDTLDELLDDLPVYWEDGCLFYSEKMKELMDWRPS